MLILRSYGRYFHGTKPLLCYNTNFLVVYCKCTTAISNSDDADANTIDAIAVFVGTIDAFDAVVAAVAAGNFGGPSLLLVLYRFGMDTANPY